MSCPSEGSGPVAVVGAVGSGTTWLPNPDVSSGALVPDATAVGVAFPPVPSGPPGTRGAVPLGSALATSTAVAVGTASGTPDPAGATVPVPTPGPGCTITTCCGGRENNMYATTAPKAAAIAMNAYATGCIPPRRGDRTPAIESGGSLTGPAPAPEGRAPAPGATEVGPANGSRITSSAPAAALPTTATGATESGATSTAACPPLTGAANPTPLTGAATPAPLIGACGGALGVNDAASGEDPRAPGSEGSAPGSLARAYEVEGRLAST